MLLIRAAAKFGVEGLVSNSHQSPVPEESRVTRSTGALFVPFLRAPLVLSKIKSQANLSEYTKLRKWLSRIQYFSTLNDR